MSRLAPDRHAIGFRHVFGSTSGFEGGLMDNDSPSNVGIYSFEDARLSSAVNKREHGARNDDDEQLRTTTLSLLATLGATAERQDKQEEDLTGMKKELASSLAGLSGRLEKQMRSVTRMHDFMHNIGDIVLGHQPSTLPAKLQRQQEDTISCLGNAFMTVFPAFFPTDDIVDEITNSKRSVDWSALKDHIHRFFKSHLHFDAYSHVWQYRSIFCECCHVDLLGVEGVQNIGDFELQSPPTCVPFERRHLGVWDEDKDRLAEKEESDYFAFIIEFFLPAFVWAFNELKKFVAYDNEAIQLYKGKMRTNQRLLERKQGTGPMQISQEEEEEEEEEPVPEFVRGTGLELRRSPVWKQNIEEVAKASAEGRTTATPQSRPVVASLKRGPPSTKREDEDKRICKRREFGSVEEPISIQRQKLTSKLGRDTARARRSADRSHVVKEVELQVEIENVQRAMAELKPKLDEAEKRLAGHVAKFDSIRQFLIIVCDKKLYQLGVLGASTPHQSSGSPFDTNEESPASKLSDDVQALPRTDANGSLSLGKDMSQLDEDSKRNVDRLSSLVYKPVAFFAENVNVVESAIDGYLDHLDATDEWSKTHWSDFRHLMAWLEVLEPLE